MVVLVESGREQVVAGERSTGRPGTARRITGRRGADGWAASLASMWRLLGGGRARAGWVADNEALVIRRSLRGRRMGAGGPRAGRSLGPYLLSPHKTGPGRGQPSAFSWSRFGPGLSACWGGGQRSGRKAAGALPANGEDDVAL